MNDSEIRESFHRKQLRRQHAREDTIVIDELGLNHGKCRADIAVVNGHLVGYEIKSNNDSLRRLKDQITSYNSVFDRISVIVGDRHIDSIGNYIPQWWGVIASERGPRGAINFYIIRQAKPNKRVAPLSLARLLWRNEAQEILQKCNLPDRMLRQPRELLYEYLVDRLSTYELRATVRKYFKKRKNWRCPELPSRCGDLFPLGAT